LGASGLINAYKTAAANAIQEGQIIKIKIRSYHKVKFMYERMNDLMGFIKHDEMEIESQVYGHQCELTFSIPVEYETAILTKLGKLYDIQVERLMTQ